MTTRNFHTMFAVRAALGKFVCVGLDPVAAKIPRHFYPHAHITRRMMLFCIAIVDATMDIVAAYKPNYAFFEAHGAKGIEALYTVIMHIQKVAPDVPIILDAKRADIGVTNEFTAEGIFDVLGADALTVHPYLGRVALAPFLSRRDKGIFVLCRTSNEGAGEFQDIVVSRHAGEGVMFLYEYVAHCVANSWNHNNNCGLVAGATYPDEIAKVRAAAPNVPLLIPGIGSQGGDLEASVKNGKDAQGKGFIINSSSGILYASSDNNFDDAARAKTIELDSAIRALL